LSGNIYDFIAALLVTSIVFTTAVFAIPRIVYVNILAVDQQQLRNTGTEVFNVMLLETGYPSDWGSVLNSNYQFDQNVVSRFGLASSEDSSFYILDPEKVQRLVTDDPVGSISYNKVRSLLGIEDYGFTLRIIPPFNATLMKDKFEMNANSLNLEFNVKVSYNDERPIAGATVESTIIYMTQSGSTARLYAAKHQESTDPVGLCNIEQLINAQSGETMTSAIAVFKVTVADLASITLTYQSVPPNNVAEINIVGDEVFLSIPDEPPSPPNNARWIDYVILFDENTFSFLHNGTRSKDDLINYGKGSPFKIWNKNFPGLHFSDQAFLLFSFWTVLPGGGRTSVLIAGPNPNWLGSRILQYGDAAGPRGGASTLKLQRSVFISGMTYIAELTFWKE